MLCLHLKVDILYFTYSIEMFPPFKWETKGIKTQKGLCMGCHSKTKEENKSKTYGLY